MIYRGVALRMKFDLRDGMGVIARGRLTVYTPRGEYQLQVEEVHPKGIGPLELAFRQLKEKLSARGYFDPARKKRLPRFPGRICLVTSGTGSAVRDMLEILGRQCMMDCLNGQVVLFVPGTCPFVQERDLIRLFFQRVRQEDLCEKVVIAVPLALVIEWNDKQVAALECFQDARAVRLPSNSIAKRPAEPFENGSSQ